MCAGLLAIIITNYLRINCGRRGGSVVNASDLGPEGREFEPWLVHLRCVLRQNTLTVPLCTQANKWGPSHFLPWGQPDKIGAYVGLTA